VAGRWRRTSLGGPALTRGLRARLPALIAALGLAATLWWLTRSDRPPSAVARAGQRLPDGEVRAALPPRFTSLRDVRPQRTPVMANLSASALAARPPGSAGPGPHLLRYRGRSGQLPPGSLARAETVVESASVQKQPELRVWLPSLRVSPAGTTLFARLRAPAGQLQQLEVEIGIAAGLESPTQFLPMKTTRDGQEPEFSWRYQAPRETRSGSGLDTPPPTAVRYLVRARGRLDGVPFVRTAGGLFYLHRPGGHLQLAATEVGRKDGDLVVKTAAVIERPGSYWAYAELWGGAGGERPIAFARERLAELPAGRHTLTLRFGGLIVRDSGVDGPYVVRNLQFKQVDTHPPHEAEPQAALPATPPWRASDFR
jgi:hypothetical protein